MKKFYNILLISIIGLVVAIAVMAFNNPPAGIPPNTNGALRVDTSGNVGIGKTPGYKLDVNGVVNATALYVGGSPYLGSQWTTAGNDIYYNTGKVGIGTATFTTYKLDVIGSVKSDTSFTAPTIFGNTFYASTGNNIAFSNSGNTTFTGNVGIGMTPGSYKLDVNGSLNATSLYIAGVQKNTVWDAKEPAIPAGTAAQYYRGDKTWQTLPSAGVSSVFGRTGAVIAASGDYTAAQVGLGNVTNESKATMFTSPTFTGNVALSGGNITGIGKITANSIDPVFKINGQQYVTYAPDAIGQKVEVVGQGQLVNGEWSIDLSQQKENSDLWLFYQIVKPETIIPLISSQSNASLYAYIDGSNLVVKLKDGDSQAKFSYQLTASRIDQKTDYIIPEVTSSVYIDVDSFKK